LRRSKPTFRPTEALVTIFPFMSGSPLTVEKIVQTK
jgi:hypothetical protein